MADESAKFQIDLALKGKEESAASRAELEKLKGSIKELSSSLAAQRESYKGLKIGGLQNTEQAMALKAQIDKTRKAIGAASMDVLKYKGSLSGTSKETKIAGREAHAAGGAFAKLAAGASTASGPIGALTGKIGSLSSGLWKAGLVGACVAGVAALVALDYAIAKTGIDVTKFAVTTLDAYRSENLALRGMTQSFMNFWGMALPRGNADKIQSAINDVAGTVSIGRDKVMGYAQELYRAGMRGQNLTNALYAVSEASSAAGEGQAQLVKNMALFSRWSGSSSKNVRDLVHSRFGAIVSAQMLSIPTQINKMKEGFKALFRGISLDPLLRGLDRVTSMFRAGTTQFEAWKTIFSTLFTPLFEQAESGGQTLRHFFNIVTNYALRTTIAFVKSGHTLRNSFKGINLVSLVSGAGTIALGLIRAAQASIILVQTLKEVVQVGVAAYKVLYAIANIGVKGNTKDWSSAMDSIKGLWQSDTTDKMLASGFQMAQGMADGITKGIPLIAKASREAGLQANDAARKATDSHSPSRVWMKWGYGLPEGGARGVQKATPRLTFAADVAARAPMAAAMNVGRPNRSVSSNSVQTGPITIMASQVTPNTVTMDFLAAKHQFAQILQGACIAKGATV